MQITGLPVALKSAMPAKPPWSGMIQPIWLVTMGSAPQNTSRSVLSTTTGQAVCCS